MSDAYIGPILVHSIHREVLLFQGLGYTSTPGRRYRRYRETHRGLESR
jgi:hypothetical protein